MTTSIKDDLIGRLTSRFDNQTARAAAINEVLAAYDYPTAFAAIVGDAADAVEAILGWAIRRGELWN